MQNLLALTTLGSMLATLAWANATPQKPRIDRQAYQACTQLHPKSFCAITHMGQ